MLQNIREKTSGWIATFILGTIIIIFGLGFGIQDFLSPQIKSDVATIEGEAKFLGFGKDSELISQAEFRERFKQLRDREMAQQGDAFDVDKFDGAESKREILEKLVDEKLILFAARQKKLVVSDAMLADAIKKIPAFHNEQGVFDVLKYKNFLAGNGLTEAQADKMIGEDALRQMLLGSIIGTSVASDAEVDAFYRLDRQTRDLRYLVIPAKADELKAPTAAETDAWYKQNSSRYRSEEKVSIEYVELNAASLPVAEKVDEIALRDLYEKNINAYRTAEQKMASHIFFAVAKDAPANIANAALAKANNVLKLARTPGADFAALAAQYSEDAGTKDTGGDLGPVEAGLFDPAFEKAFAGLQLGQISNPVRTADGYELILFRESIAGEARTFEEVRPELETRYFENERERALSDRVSDLLEKAYSDPNTLAASAKKIGLTAMRTGPFTRTQGEGLAALEPIRKAAFSAPLKVNREVSDAIEIAEGQIVIMRVVDHKPVADIPLAQIRDRVQADFQAERSEKAALKRAEAFQDRANKGENLDALATEIGAQVAVWPMMTRNPPIPQLADVAKAAFALPRPDAKTKQVGIAKLQGDSYALIEVVAVKEGDISTLDTETRKNTRQQFAQARARAEIDDYVKALRKQYKVTVVEANL
jgi:peptidyl-prolyl cis-trans isomerase D